MNQSLSVKFNLYIFIFMKTFFQLHGMRNHNEKNKFLESSLFHNSLGEDFQFVKNFNSRDKFLCIEFFSMLFNGYIKQDMKTKKKKGDM